MTPLTSGMLLGVDTNIILRAVLGDDAIQSSLARQALGDRTPESPAFITGISLAEVFWVLRSRVGREAALGILRRLVESESMEFDDGEGVVRALAFADAGADFADALIHGTMEQFGASTTVTFDRRASEHLGWRLLGS